MAKRLSWAVRIERAEKRGKFTEQEHNLSGEWSKCAVGEKHGWQDTESGDDAEFTWGVAFCTAVCRNDVPEARRLYTEIMALPA